MIINKDADASEEVQYRFPRVKDASWNSYNRQRERFEVVAPLIPPNSVGAEIGVYKGGFGEFLLTRTRVLYLVDPWHRLRPFWGSERNPEMSAVSALINVLTVHQSDIESGRVIVVVDFGEAFLNSLPESSLDWVYLDASHRYEATTKEINAAYRVIRSGGVLIGDDYDRDPSSNQHGVFRAVNDFVAAHPHESLLLDRSRQWAVSVRKPPNIPPAVATRPQADRE